LAAWLFAGKLSYNLKYLIAAALLDDEVGPSRIEGLVQLLAKVNPEPRYPAKHPRIQ
jgi:hypothetical protein